MYFTYGGGAVFALDKSEAAASEPALGAGGTDALTADQLARRSAASASRRDYDSALADLNRALVLEPASAALLAQRGAVFTALRQPKPALQDYDQALQLDANQVEARARRAALRVRAKDLEGARADLAVLDQTIAPQSAMRLSMGHLYLALDQPKPAIAQFDAWLAAHPSEARRDGALNARCWARVRLGVELDRALDDCNDAIDADAGNAAYYDSRGWLYLRRGQYQQAVDDFSRSVERQPKSAWSLFGRGLARGRLGDAAQGEADLAAARKLEPDVDATLARTGLGAAAAPAR